MSGWFLLFFILMALALASSGVPLKRLTAFFIVIACLVIVATGLDGIGISFLAFLFSLVIGLPTLVLGAVAAILHRQTPKSILLCLASLVFFTYPFARIVELSEAFASRNYCETWVSKLEIYKNNHGSYPSSLSQVDPALHLKPLRALIHGDDEACGYEKKDDLFVLRFPSDVFSEWRYQSDEQVWENIDLLD